MRENEKGEDTSTFLSCCYMLYHLQAERERRRKGGRGSGISGPLFGVYFRTLVFGAGIWKHMSFVSNEEKRKESSACTPPTPHSHDKRSRRSWRSITEQLSPAVTSPISSHLEFLSIIVAWPLHLRRWSGIRTYLYSWTCESATGLGCSYIWYKYIRRDGSRG